MRVTEYEDDHEKEISQSDGETMKKVTTTRRRCSWTPLSC